MKQDAPTTAVNDLSLPEDLQVCQHMIRELLTQLRDQKNELEGVQQRLDQLLRRLYGPKGEKCNPLQPTLFDNLSLSTDIPVSPPPEPESPAASIPVKPKKKGHGHGRKALPENLRRETVIHDLTDAEILCPCCRGIRIKMGEEISEKLDYQPSSMFVVEHVRYKYGCVQCLRANVENTTASRLNDPLILTAPMPPSVIDKGLAEPGLIAHVIVSKYMDHLPLHRLEGIFQRQGVVISRSTMCDWMAASALLLTPLYQYMLAEVLKSKVVQLDETLLPVQAVGQTQSCRLWEYRGDRDHPYVIYDFRTTKARAGPEEILKDYKGFLQADAANVFDGIYRPGAIVEVACWAHARRKFYESQTNDRQVSAEALARIAGLYAVESEAAEEIAKRGLTGDAADALRLQYRRDKSVPQLSMLKTWIDDTAVSSLPKSQICQALGYAQRQWQALNRFAEHGYLHIDNNATERGFRPVALGRRYAQFRVMRSCERPFDKCKSFQSDTISSQSCNSA